MHTSTAFTVGTVAMAAFAHHALGAPFEILSSAVIPDASITPSSGSFVTQDAVPGGEGVSLVDGVRVRTDPAAWIAGLDVTMASTWLTHDRWGPKGRDGTATYGQGWFETATGPAGTARVPEAEHSLGGPGLAINGNDGDPVDGDGLSPGFFAASGGFLWDREPGDFTRSDRSIINGQPMQSIFLGHFVLSDPDATLVGERLLIGMEPIVPNTYPGIFVPLDGSRGVDLLNSNPITTGDEVPFWIEYERVTFTNALGTFTALDMYLVPAPSALAFPALALVPLLRRRRGA